MSRLLSCLIAMLLLAPLGAQADSWRHDRRDHRVDDRRYDRHAYERRYDRRDHDNRYDRRFDDHRHAAPWRGHRGWHDYGSRRFDSFHPGSRAFDRRAPLALERLHRPPRLHHPRVLHGRHGPHRHRR